MDFELKLNATVTLDATPALVGALERLADALKGGEAKAPAKTRTKTAVKVPEAEAAGELPAQPAAVTTPSSTASPATAAAAQPVNPAPAPSTSLPVTPAAAPATAPASPVAVAPKGIGPDEARSILIAIVQKHHCSDALQAKLHELGYQTQHAMADDVRADFVAWARQTYPITDAEIL